MNQRVVKRLHDVVVTSREVNLLVQENTLESYLGNFRTRLLMQKLLEVIGEALAQASRLEPALDDEIPGLKTCVDMRNRMIHGHDSVGYNAVWNAATRDVPSIATAVEALIADEPLDSSVTLDSWFSND